MSGIELGLVAGTLITLCAAAVQYDRRVRLLGVLVASLFVVALYVLQA